MGMYINLSAIVLSLWIPDNYAHLAQLWQHRWTHRTWRPNQSITKIYLSLVTKSPKRGLKFIFFKFKNSLIKKTIKSEIFIIMNTLTVFLVNLVRIFIRIIKKNIYMEILMILKHNGFVCI